MVKYTASILVAAALVAAARAEQHHSAPRDLTNLDLFEREIPFDLGDLSARDDADLYTREFFESELSERDVELLKREPNSWSKNVIKQYAVQYGPKPASPSSSELTTRELGIDAELFERDLDELMERDLQKRFFLFFRKKQRKADDADLSERDLADDSNLLERNFDDSDLLERDFEELEARESLWEKFRKIFTGKKGKDNKKKKEEAEKKKAAEAKKKAEADAKKAEADDLAERDFDEDVFEREFDDELMEREFDDELLERDLDEDVFERDIAEEDLYQRDFEEMFERDVDDELLERQFDEDYLVEREIDELD